MSTYVKWLISIFIISLYPITFYLTKNKLKQNYLEETKFQETKNEDNESLEIIDNKLVLGQEEMKITSPTINPNINRNLRFSLVVSDYSNSSGEISFIEKNLSKNIHRIGIYKQFGLDSNKDLVESDLAFIKKGGKSLMIAWEPWNPNEGLNQSVDFISEINNGKYDEYIRSFALQMKNHENPIILRFGHEMNGNWYPWGLRPSEFISSYRRVVDLVRSSNVTNVKFMWSINSESVPYEPIDQIVKYYPGDEYVDIIGIDGFNFGESQKTSRWRQFKELFKPAYSFISKNYPSKKIIISEVSSSELGGNKAKWIDDMFASLNTMPNIEEIIWFNLVKETDWRIDSSESSLNAFKNNFH